MFVCAGACDVRQRGQTKVMIVVCLQNVWVWCESEDVKIEQKSPGIPFSFFPYHKQSGYLSPLVPVRLLNLEGKAENRVDYTYSFVACFL